MDKVIPPGLNYADIKPEAIENQIKIIKYTPISNIMNTQPNDVIRFHLQGNGFYDPYSAYIRMEVSVAPDDIANPTVADIISGMAIDRSAHSFIQRLVIRSQGTELERIEQYDVMAGMVNDMVYNAEQRLLHHYEGFGANTVGNGFFTSPEQAQKFCSSQGGGMVTHAVQNILSPLSGDTVEPNSVDQGFFKYCQRTNGDDRFDPLLSHLSQNTIGDPFIGIAGNGQPVRMSNIQRQPQFIGDYATVANVGLTNGAGTLTGQTQEFAAVVKVPIPANVFDDVDQTAVETPFRPGFTLGQERVNIADGTPISVYKTPMTLVFCIPIYSGIIGVMQPDKKLIPMSLLPLEVEFTLNPYALYAVGACTQRKYVMNKFEIFAHTMFFEQELHRSLEAVVAENGLFIHYSSFYCTPINTYSAQMGPLPQYHQLGLFLKSIDAIHWTFLYQNYEAANGPRKLHFNSHNVKKLQLRNGMELTPSEPLMGRVGGNSINWYSGEGTIGQNHVQFLIETYKAWNKMHDPSTDCALTAFNYNLDYPMTKPTNLASFIKNCQALGRCQYGISMIGEELGQNKTIVSGKKSVLPFDLNLDGIKQAAAINGVQPFNSVMICFLRADFIIYVRPDLIVTRLGI